MIDLKSRGPICTCLVCLPTVHSCLWFAREQVQEVVPTWLCARSGNSLIPGKVEECRLKNSEVRETLFDECKF